MYNTGNGLAYVTEEHKMVDLVRQVMTVVLNTLTEEGLKERMYRSLIWAFESNGFRVCDQVRGLDVVYDRAFYDSHPMWGKL